MARPGVLVSSENGYIFPETFFPVIKELGKACRIYVLVADFHLAESVKEELRALEANKTIETFRITYTDPKRGESLRHYHKRLYALAHSLGALHLDMIVLNGDFQIAHRYILSQFQDPRIKRVVLQGGLNIRFLQAYRHAKGLDVNGGAIIRGPIDSLLWPLRLLKKKARSLRMDFRQWRNYYFFPYWQQKQVFPLTGYERLAFASGICEHVICYDRQLKEALKLVNPLIQHVHLARHPLEGAAEGSAGERLLVLFAGNVATELPEEKMNRWVDVTRQVVALKNCRAIELRFHPRTSLALRWPEKMRNAMQTLGCPVTVVDTEQVPFRESLDRYAGILGAPSAALRVARAMNKSLFILGLANCGDGDLYDQSWSMGAGEGIHWVREGKRVTPDQLRPPAVTGDRLPTVPDILLKLLTAGSVSYAV